MERTSAADIIARARSRTDTETPTPTNDHITDAYLTDTLKLAYRNLMDMVLAASGEAGIELYATNVILTGPDYDFPAGVHKVIDVRRFNGRDWQPLPTANWRTRHRGGSSDWPIYTIIGDQIFFDPPTAAPGDLQMWYIPTLDAMLQAGDYITVNGWDEYLVGYLANEIAVKSDLPTGDHRDLMKDSSKRIQQAARDLKMGHTKTLACVETFPEDFFGRW